MSGEIVTLARAVEKRWYWKRIEMVPVAFTNGCFDVLHPGHIHLLKIAAAGKMNRLIIGLNSDRSVRELKGPGRPVNDEMKRASALAALPYVDAVVIFQEKTPEQLIKLLQPDVLVKGGDYQKKDIVGAELVERLGGNVIIASYLKGHSSTDLIAKGRR